MVEVKRKQLKRNVIGVDVTAMSSVGPAKALAPTWELVMGHKNGAIDDDSYARAYGALLELVPTSTWDWLVAQADDNEVTLLCYCRDDKFCHTHLIALYAAYEAPVQFRCSTSPPPSVLNTEWCTSLLN